MAEPIGRYFLWQGYVLYAGRGGRSALHRHHMIQLGVSLDRPIHARTAPDAPYTAYQGLFVDADQPHQIVATSRRPVLFLWIDPESRTARRLRAHFDTGLGPLPDDLLGPLQEQLLRQALPPAGCEEARRLAALMQQTLDPGAAAPLVDPRIDEVIRLIRARRAGALPSVDELAEAVFLSPSRLMHLFREQIGLPIRRYGLWQRMLLALRYMAGGTPLTQAAHAAGFADAAHLTRTFRAMFGVTPSNLFKNSRFIQATACYEA